MINDTSELESGIGELVNEGLIKDGQVEEITGIAKTFFEMPEFRKWFDGSWEVMNERSILSKGVTYRPDKVLIKGDEAMVIDYKSGDRENKHIKQISQYGELLAEMNYSNIRKYLVYLDLKEIEEVN